MMVCTCLAGGTAALASPQDRIGEKLSDVTLLDLRGRPVQLLQQHTGEVLVIAYTGLGCPISGRYAPRLEALRLKLEPKGVRFVAINANPHDGLDKIGNFGRHIDGNVFIREINRRFEQGRRADQAFSPAFGALAQITGQHAQGLAALCLGLGFDQIGKAFDLSQIEPAIFHRPTGEFTRISGPQSVDIG